MLNPTHVPAVWLHILTEIRYMTVTSEKHSDFMFEAWLCVDRSQLRTAWFQRKEENMTISVNFLEPENQRMSGMLFLSAQLTTAFSSASILLFISEVIRTRKHFSAIHSISLFSQTFSGRFLWDVINVFLHSTFPLCYMFWPQVLSLPLYMHLQKTRCWVKVTWLQINPVNWALDSSEFFDATCLDLLIFHGAV